MIRVYRGPRLRGVFSQAQCCVNGWCVVCLLQVGHTHTMLLAAPPSGDPPRAQVRWSSVKRHGLRAAHRPPLPAQCRVLLMGLSPPAHRPWLLLLYCSVPLLSPPVRVSVPDLQVPAGQRKGFLEPCCHPGSVWDPEYSSRSPGPHWRLLNHQRQSEGPGRLVMV